MVKIKEEDVDILNWYYIKEKDEYVIIFRISNLKPEKREKIIKMQKSGVLKSQGANIDEIVEVGDDLYVKEYYENKDIEMYKSLIPLAQSGVIPERLDPDRNMNNFTIPLNTVFLPCEIFEKFHLIWTFCEVFLFFAADFGMIRW